jgi:ribosomal protein L1
MVETYAGVQGIVGATGTFGPSIISGTVPSNITNILVSLTMEKMSLKSGDILVVHYPEGMPMHDLHKILQQLQRINNRLKEKGIDLSDIVLFNEGVKLSVLSPNLPEEKPSDYRRIELE